MKKYLVFIFLFLSIGLVFASTIEDTTVHIKVYNSTLEFTNPDYAGNNKNVSINITNGTIVQQEFDFSILFVKNESVDVSTVSQLTNCLVAKATCDTEKSQLNMGWNICRTDLDKCNSNNNQSIKDQLSSCISEKQRLQIDLESKTKKVTDLEAEQKSTGNAKFFWAIGGGAIVFVAMMFITGKWGNQGKDKTEEEFGRQRGY